MNLLEALLEIIPAELTLSGSRILDEEAAITTIQQGATFPQVKGARLVTMSKRD